MSHRYHTMNVFGRSQGTRHQSPSSSMQECQWEDEGWGGVPLEARHATEEPGGVSLQPQSRRGGSDITQGETGDDDTPFTLTYDRCRAAPARRTTSMAGGGPGRKGPGRRPVPGPRDVRPAQVPRRRPAPWSSGCRLRSRCRTSWSVR